jgi:hypothetical protein
LQLPGIREVKDEEGSKYYCTIVDSNGEYEYEWDTRNMLGTTVLLCLFPEAIGAGLIVLDEVVLIIKGGGIKLEPTKKYVVPVPLVRVLKEFIPSKLFHISLQQQMENNYCTIIDSIGRRQYKWDTNNKIDDFTFRSLFPETDGKHLVCDDNKVEISLAIGWTKLEPQKKVSNLLHIVVSFLVSITLRKYMRVERLIVK